MEIRQAYNFILAVYFESKSDRVMLYVILLSSDCFKVQGHLVPRLYTTFCKTLDASKEVFMNTEVTSLKHLGLHISKDCAWHEQIEYIKEKASLRINVMHLKFYWIVNH